MRKGSWIVVGLLLIGLGGAYFWYQKQKNRADDEPYGTALKPRLEMSSFEFTNITSERADMTMKMLIDNPLPVAFKAKGVDYKVYIGDALVAEDAYRKTIQVESDDSTLVQMPVKVYLKKMTEVLKTLENKGVDSVDYRIQSTFDMDVPIMGERTFSVNTSKKLPVYYIPKVKIEEIDLGKLGLKRTDLAVKVDITNKNQFPFKFRDTKYTVSIDGEVIAEGTQSDDIRIAKDAVTPVVFPVTMRPNKLDNVVWKALFEKKNTPYEVILDCKLISEDNSFKNSPFKTRISGTLEDLKGAKK
ncbi:LEA type 2 family protein [Tellurirhabdus rosea]|uniref:LEA type 2 family protein n=1 Tax=Tellurirhabdus rosea TaxID=2674997 RepID=UPI00224DEA56|nr:LEA type 2 family protein [Tellurirhabdus rosea]